MLAPALRKRAWKITLKITSVGKERARLSREEISLVFDCYKWSIFSIYSKHLMKDPELAGRLILIFDVEVNGRVSNIKVESNTIDDQRFIRELKARVKLFEFPVKNDRTVNIKYPVEFLGDD